VALVVFLRAFTFDQMYCALVLVGGALLLQARNEPFVTRGQNQLEYLSLTTTVVTLIGGIALHGGEVCRGTWARVTIDRRTHLSISTFEKHSASSNTFSNRQVQYNDVGKGIVEWILFLQNLFCIMTFSVCIASENFQKAKG
jgi:hypothetical protein